METWIGTGSCDGTRKSTGRGTRCDGLLHSSSMILGSGSLRPALLRGGAACGSAASSISIEPSGSTSQTSMIRLRRKCRNARCGWVRGRVRSESCSLGWDPAAELAARYGRADAGPPFSSKCCRYSA
eukprot:5054665-Prymnesium_polylepis.1